MRALIKVTETVLAQIAYYRMLYENSDRCKQRCHGKTQHVSL
ncbi:hypothetical protein LSH36_44g12002 [Paralvinella palmiformis]|uniref:Uncharacterized protein n=1 Tax=Paralvinella palmiformis TaxID=53620 RepID=A0AAD9K6T8_9ANNE|nr:hypothetical protein LSH36_44g12002 [Paralvinella palmiformis]